MAILTKCPNCQKAYNLPDEFAGKRVTCRKEDCRKVFTVVPTANGAHPPNAPIAKPAPKPTKQELEAQALAAMSEHEAAAQAPVSTTVPVVCGACDHKFEVSRDMIGKNALCPECKHRNRVVAPKDDKPKGWRPIDDGKPAFAKRDIGKLDNVISAGDAKAASEAAVKQAGADKPLETTVMPRWMKALVWLGGTTLALLVAWFMHYWFIRGPKVSEENLIASGVKLQRTQSAALTDAATSKQEKDRLKRDDALRMFVLVLSQGEYAVREGKAEDALKSLQEARQYLTNLPANPVRNLALIELAAAQAELGGTPAQVEAKQRIGWDAVRKQVRQTLQNLDSPDELHRIAARQLTRRLQSTGHPDQMPHLARLLAVGDAQAEMLGVVGLELLSLKEKAKADDLAKEIQGMGDGKGSLFLRSAPALGLWLALNPDDATPTFTLPSPTASPISREANGTKLAYRGKLDEARQFVETLRGEDRVRLLLTLAAHEAERPTPSVVDLEQLAGELPSVATANAPWLTLEAAHLAARSGKGTLAKSFTDTLTDPGLKSWGELLTLKGKLTLEGKSTRPDVKWLDSVSGGVPKTPSLAYLFARREFMRSLTAHNHDTNPKKTVDRWDDEEWKPFGYVGAALGQQRK